MAVEAGAVEEVEVPVVEEEVAEGGWEWRRRAKLQQLQIQL